MGFPRRRYVQEGQEGIYHCFSRCVRRAFLYGFDKATGRDFSHRKAWLLSRLRHLASIFAIDVCAYAIMDNHYHLILRTRPDIAAAWSDHEVAERWLTLYPHQPISQNDSTTQKEIEINALADCPERIALLRQRLSNLSWFMGRLNEYIARVANKEDKVTGKFWEARFKCRALLDEAAIATGMVYVDLNAIRAGRAISPETSDFTSIQERIRAWQKEQTVATTDNSESIRQVQSDINNEAIRTAGITCDNSDRSNEPLSAINHSPDDSNPYPSWLCPIHSDNPQKRGIFRMTATEYFEMVDRSGRMVRSGKRGAIDPELAPILLRIGITPEAWLDTVTHFGSRFHLAVGLLSNLRSFADRIGVRWLKGAKTAQAAFTSPLSQSS